MDADLLELRMRSVSLSKCGGAEKGQTKTIYLRLAPCAAAAFGCGMDEGR
jgi:hypothetical protein